MSLSLNSLIKEIDCKSEIPKISNTEIIKKLEKLLKQNIVNKINTSVLNKYFYAIITPEEKFVVVNDIPHSSIKIAIGCLNELPFLHLYLKYKKEHLYIIVENFNPIRNKEKFIKKEFKIEDETSISNSLSHLESYITKTLKIFTVTNDTTDIQ